MKKYIAIAFSFYFSMLSLFAQEAGTRYEVTGYMPAFFEQMKQKLNYPMAYENSGIKKFSKWKKEARDLVYDLMQIIPDAPQSWDMEVLEVEKREGYEARKIMFNVSEWSRVPAYLLVPEGNGPFPAVLMLHDHGAHFTIGKEKMVRPFNVSEEIMADADKWTVACYDSVYVGDYFAQNGYVVLSVDALFWGERGRKEGANYDIQQAMASNFLQMGGSWGALINIDDVRSAEFLASLPFVDSKKIASLGHSMGGYRSWMVSALTDVVSASVAVCWFATTDGLMTMKNNQAKGGSSYSMIIPGLRRYMDYAHVAALACPKPALFFNGKNDKLFPVESAEEGYEILRKTWKSQKADDRLVTKIYDEKHYFNRAMQKASLDFLNQWLKK